MIDAAETTDVSSAGLPPILRAEHDAPPLSRGPWYLTIGPAYLGIFVWAPFFDWLWVSDLTRWTWPWLIASAVFASLLCFVLFYWIPVSWGLKTGRPLGIMAASTFGTVGSEWITGVAVGVASILWYAVAIDYAVESVLVGLRSCGLIAAEGVGWWDLGPIVVKSPVYLTTAVFWIYITGTSALWRITGVVAALMKVYAPIALLLLTAVALVHAPVLAWFRTEDAAKLAAKSLLLEQSRGLNSVLSLITGFFAMAGLLSVDWGARLERRRDVVLGGLMGLVLAASCAAVMALAVVAGAVARVQAERVDWGAHEVVPLSFRWAVYRGLGGIPGGTVLILFGLAALAPACYSAWVFSQKLSTHWPLIGRAGWTWIGGAVALVLGATGYASLLNVVFFGMGVFFGPAVGAMAGDWLRQRGEWAGMRPGVHRPGLIAWGAGLGVALAVEIGRTGGDGFAPWWYSSSVCGFVASAACYLLLARMGHDSPVLPIAPRGR